MYNFEYINATSLQALGDSLSKNQNETVILAGGTDLMDRLKERLIKPKHVINIIPYLPTRHKTSPHLSCAIWVLSAAICVRNRDAGTFVVKSIIA